MPLPLEQVDAAIVRYLRHGKGDTPGPVITVETEKLNVVLQFVLRGRSPVGFYWVLDLVELRDFEIFVRLGRAAAVSALVLGTT